MIFTPLAHYLPTAIESNLVRGKMQRKQTSSSTVAVRSVVATRSEKSEKADLEAPLVLFSLFILCLKKKCNTTTIIIIVSC